MNRARWFVVGAGVVVLASSPTAVPQEPSVLTAAVTVEYVPRSEWFSGTVQATELEGYNEPGCLRLRHVVIKRVRPGRDQVINRDLTNRSGHFGIPYLRSDGGPQLAGTFYAKVVGKVLDSKEGDSHAVCEAAESSTIEITQP